MSIELLPFSSFALESCAAPAPSPGEGQTLTLPLRLGRVPGAALMTGQLALRATDVALPGTQRASIAAGVQAPPLTITF